jgi:hypothetical protein
MTTQNCYFFIPFIENVFVQGVGIFSDRKTCYFCSSSPEGWFGLFGFALGRVLGISAIMFNFHAIG